MSGLVNDALALLAALTDARPPRGGIEGLEGEAAQAVALLALVAGQDVEPAEGSDGTDGRWRIARRTAPDRVISTVDPDARHAHKSQHKRGSRPTLSSGAGPAGHTAVIKSPVRCRRRESS